MSGAHGVQLKEILTMRQLNSGQCSHCKNVVDEFLFAQSNGVHNLIEMIAGGSGTNSRVPQGVFDIASDTENLPEGQFQKFEQVAPYILQSHRCLVDEYAYDTGTSSRAFERSPSVAWTVLGQVRGKCT